MATTITAGNATNGAAISSDNTGILELKTGTGSGTTALTLGTTGNINFPISGQRITGDFSNGTVANRVMFQTSTVNGTTSIATLPNGTNATSSVLAFGGSDPANAPFTGFNNTATESQILASKLGTGTFLPMTFYTGGSERMRVDTSGNVGVGTSSPSNKLDVAGVVRVSANSGSVSHIFNFNENGGEISLYNNTGTSGTLIDLSNGISRALHVLSTGDLLVGLGAANTTGSIQFMRAGYAEAMRIDSSGNVLIGTTTQATGAQLTVNGSIKGTITSGSAQTAPFASPNTSCDFTGIPSWVKRITVMFSGVSTNGTSDFLIQIGDSGGVETSGYGGAVTRFNGTLVSTSNTSAGYLFAGGSGVGAASLYTGKVMIEILTGSTYVISGLMGSNANVYTALGACAKTLSDTLTQVRITTVNGTDTFDAGTINILYEG